MTALDLNPLPNMQPNDIFDRRRIRIRRDTQAQRKGTSDFLLQQLAGQMLERLGDVQRTWSNALLIGSNPLLEHALGELNIALTLADPSASQPQNQVTHVVPCDMDRIIHAQRYGPFDLILWPGGLESTNDVPGALAQCRHLLKPDGLLLGAFYGAGSLPLLRQLIQKLPENGEVARFHPQIDARAMGDLLQRTGFALPTVDVERLQLGYRSLGDLLADLRGAALTNALSGTIRTMRMSDVLSLNTAFQAAAKDAGRTVETMALLHFIAWAPHDSQPKPARRGSATASLQSALGSGPIKSPPAV
jgi:NADH dehydrogenase [ubiquinone] 1 alpha subcomplex assembly factor 5